MRVRDHESVEGNGSRERVNALAGTRPGHAPAIPRASPERLDESAPEWPSPASPLPPLAEVIVSGVFSGAVFVFVVATVTQNRHPPHF